MSRPTEFTSPLPPADVAAGLDDSSENRTPAFTASEEVKEHFVHPSAKQFFDRHPWTRRIPIFGPACEGYGPKCIAGLAVVHLFCRGIADELVEWLAYSMLVNRYGIEGERYQRLATLHSLGWSAKPLTAMVCDGFAFLGYTKRWYMAISCVAGAACALAFALLPAEESSADTAGALIFLTSYFKANVDILSEGFYSRIMIKHPEQGPVLVSWVWWFILIGNIVSALLIGPLTDAKVPQVGIYISMALQLLTTVVFIFNWYGERTNQEERAEDARYRYLERLKDKELVGLVTTNDGELKMSDNGGEVALQKPPMDSTEEETAELLEPEPVTCCCGLFDFNKDVFVDNWRAFVYGVILTGAVVVMILFNILSGKMGLLIACVSVSLVCCGASFWALPLAIAKVNVFGYLQALTFILLPGALNTFYMADKECLPDGPHFSYTFYNGVFSVFSNVGALIGVVCFSYFFPKVNYRFALIMPTIGIMSASLIDITIVKRWNTKIGIPDHFIYLFGYSVIVQIFIKLQIMPMFVLLSRLCPRGSESLVYALLAGFTSLGKSSSTTLGASLMEFVWPVKTKVPCDYSNLVWLILFSHGIAPAISIPFIFLLIPSARICDKLDVNGRVVKDEVDPEAVMRTEPLAEGEGKRSTGVSQ